MLWALIASYVVSAAMGITAILYAGHVDSESNKQWCDLLVPLDNAYQETPPTTPVGRNIADAMHRIRQNFEC
jgi:hypothetical protein